MSGTRTITRDPDRTANAKATHDALRLHRDTDRTAETTKASPAQGSVQADLDNFRSYHHEQALSDVAGDSTGAATVDNDYLASVEALNGVYEAASSDGELSVSEQNDLLGLADEVSDAEIASRDAFDVDVPETPAMPTGANPPLNPADVPSNFRYVSAPTAEQIAEGAPLGFGHDDDGDNRIVSDVQQRIFDGGFYGDGATADEVDGFYGPRTQAAVEAFQADQGLEVTGQVGQDELVQLGLADAPADTDTPAVPTEPARTADGRVIPGSIPTPSIADGAPERVELRGGSADRLVERGDRLTGQGYIHDGMGTYYHPDVALGAPGMREELRGGSADRLVERGDRLREQGYIHDGNGTYYNPSVAHLIPGRVVDLSGAPSGIVNAETPELRAQGYVTNGDDAYVHPDLVEQLGGSPVAAERRAETLRAEGWLSDGNGRYFHPGVAHLFLD